MRVPDNDVRNQLVDTVNSFYIGVAPEELLDGMEHPPKPKPRTFNSDIYFSRLSLSEALLWLLYISHLISFFQLPPCSFFTIHIFPFSFIPVGQFAAFAFSFSEIHT